MAKLLLGKLRLSKDYQGTIVKMQDGQEYTVFRTILNPSLQENNPPVVFIVRFKFARLSHEANRMASILPMLLITGFPGFQTKIYAVNPKNGYWQGMYQWKSKQALEEYKQSLVFKVMNRRAISNSLSSTEFNDQVLTEFIENNRVS